eukprot:s703_g7.t1
MDPVSRRRRGQRSEEPVIPDQDRDFEYQAALSLANPSSVFPSGAFNVEASPGTSSAEAELVGMSHAIQMSESVQPLVDELLSVDSTVALLADNSAAIRAFDSAPSGCSRHLRMRAISGREKIETNQLTVSPLARGVPGC